MRFVPEGTVYNTDIVPIDSTTTPLDDDEQQQPKHNQKKKRRIKNIK